ncbi:DUF4142 domain-containing protein [Catenuloplanes indicus]|uniref:Outer membrane protein n=1 Tax=Catenuloplanes indicus TaxID=137267 RepID=A0AAE4AZM9_9ACTN|nr:DUF4142 domain-containing protein [Catenuloplanes indicus]MDQ0369315.1 putative outer membrane protein [Catenuloplanes indicus]
MAAVRLRRRGARAVSTLAILGAVLFSAPAVAFAQAPTPEVVDPAAQDPSGPITSADEQFVIAVRLAGLWEIPAGDMASEKGESQRVKEVGEALREQHKELDGLAVDAAAKLNIQLPNEPNQDQSNWLAEMEAAEGAEFDEIFVARLRAAHGKIIPVVSTIRAATRNDVVRALAQQTNAFVMTHLTLLESTDLVNYAGLPAAPNAQADPVTGANALLAAAQARGATGGFDTTAIWLVLVVAVVAGAFGAVRIIRSR